MEVHHHSGKHEKAKKFKDYFLEFLMIFLAVTLGFLAESLRESISDKEKEKEYINSLIQNLKDDTATLNACITENEAKVKRLKDLANLSTKNLSDPAIRKLFYEYTGKSVSFYSIFISNDATMLQLKNSGGLRLIRSHHVADSIAKYDQEIKSIYAAETLYSSAADQATAAGHEIFDYMITYDSSYYKNGKFTDKLLPLITSDPQKIKWFFNKADYEIGATNNYLDNLRRRRPFAAHMIQFLRKEYDIE
ncbi:MAG: hypothetical protein JST75_19570 [Bacteroidetes bacterium]|nr:hypothetical protein [Bacteroidota bacterium]